MTAGAAVLAPTRFCRPYSLLRAASREEKEGVRGARIVWPRKQPTPAEPVKSARETTFLVSHSQVVQLNECRVSHAVGSKSSKVIALPLLNAVKFQLYLSTAENHGLSHENSVRNGRGRASTDGHIRHSQARLTAVSSSGWARRRIAPGVDRVRMPA